MTETTSFQELERELNSYQEILSKASDSIIEQEVSKYPIFVVHQLSADIGIPMVDKDDVNGNWSINASSLEEFVTKQIIQNEKVENFKSIYKNSKTNFCLFVLSNLGAKFVFIPRKY